ncbi:cation acetate symporter [Streptomyces lunaelactis]|uniref:sodium/solute symporter n=1 Tax=Streptomyces lunaelactis TaxID=1535768 RepID=UPI0015844CAF|nr:cation acetate symporter [Streptomyces lunaelactis]NUK05343.1 cation acetate symporter [Streptomyces lunaelactis]NUK13123.1 cation acetate symporter [Streptomyces lunaelactis]NUK19733.1 cation acetate symporter [Streptomyces lunaelactis]NUK27190.1 cation acetate symporter [Streptomyces lunaelactis]NUK38334.1 cation acetate symporter [Streptomyces lunaelactis]
MTGFGSEAQTMSLVAFIAVTTVTLLLCVMTGPDREDLDEFYTGYRSLTPMQSGLAIAGDYISAASVLGTIGVISLVGQDGLVLALSTALSLVLLMFLLAEPLRNAGRFTMGDVLTRRTPSPAVRITACIVTLLALFPLLIFQLAGAGDLLAFVLGMDSPGFKTVSIVLLGLLMIIYAAIGGMKGTAFIQIVKTVVLLAAAVAIASLILNRFDFSIPSLLDAAAAGSGLGDAYLAPGLQFGGDGLDMISAQLTVVLGAACLPHITMRMFSSRSAPAVRRSMSWAVSTVVVMAVLSAVIGFGAAAIVGHQQITAGDPQGKISILLVSQAIMGTEVSTFETLLFTAMATAIFLTLLASVAGITLACANTLAHDLITHGLRRKQALRDSTEMTVARATAAAVGLAAILLAAASRHVNLQAMVTLSFCLGASAVAPALVYSLFWRRYNRTGLLSTLIGGTLSVVILITGTTLVSGSPQAIFPDDDFTWFPYTTTGLVSIPAGFLAGWLGTVAGRNSARARQQQEYAYEAVEASILADAARPPRQ